MNFKIKEFLQSETADKFNINNEPDNYIIYENIMRLVVDILQPLRNYYKKPIIINSGYRCLKLNQKINGARNSQHLYGQAVDFTVSGETISSVIKTIKKLNLPYDQLINEYGKWIHISIKEMNNRKQEINL